MQPLPESATVTVSPTLAADLLAAAESLPVYETQDFYSLELQAELRREIRNRLPGGWDELAGEIRARLARAPWCALVRGLLFDSGNRLFVALNREFGEFVARPYEKPRAQLVHYIQPATDIRAASGATTYESERLHTDSADWPVPVPLVSMTCVRPDRHGGGHSRLLTVDALREEIATALGVDTLELLEQRPMPWDLASYLGGGVAWQPILTPTSVRWRRYTIDAALAGHGLALEAEVTAALDGVGAVVDGTARVHDFFLEQGDWLLFDNHRTLHGRTALGGLPGGSDRLMIRSWVRPEQAA